MTAPTKHRGAAKAGGSGSPAASSAPRPSLGSAISDLVTKRKLDCRRCIEEIEEVLIRADLGVDVAGAIADRVGEGRYDKAITPTR